MVTTCTDSTPSYIYWNSSGSTSPISIKNNQASDDETWVGSGPLPSGQSGCVLLTSQQYAKTLTLNQVPGDDYYPYVRYGDQVLVQEGSNILAVNAGCGPGFTWLSPQPDPSEYPISFGSTSKSPSAPILYGDSISINTHQTEGYWGSPINSPAQPAMSDSPLYAYEIQDSTFSTKLQTQFTCYGTNCICAESPSGAVSYSSCQSTCGESGSPLPGDLNTYTPFPGVSALSLAGCGGETVTHTYTLYSGGVSNMWLLFILGETTDSVTASVPGNIKPPRWPSTNGFLLFTWNSDGSGTIEQGSGNGPTVSWDPNSTWKSWGKGGNAKTITVDISMTAMTFTLGGSSHSMTFADVGYASGVYCNLYAAQGIADADPKLAVASTASLGLVKPGKPAKPMAPNWWWWGLVLTGAITIAMILLVTWAGGH